MARTTGGEGQDPVATPGGDPQPPTPSEAPKRHRTDSDGIQYFDTTITKIRVLEDGTEMEVMSDHLMPGEKLKRTADDEKAEKQRKEAEKKAK